jgi:hypothetical protein
MPFFNGVFVHLSKRGVKTHHKEDFWKKIHVKTFTKALRGKKNVSCIFFLQFFITFLTVLVSA